MNILETLYNEIIFEGRKTRRGSSKSKKHKWNPKKYYKNSTYAFVPHGGIKGFSGGDTAGMIAGAGSGGGGGGE